MDTAHASSSISKGRFLGATCVADCTWEIPTSAKPGMLVPARIFATESLLEHMDRSVFEQVTNVACLPGIVRASFCMPDGHSGYGFPIGGVAAFRPEDGVISPGGIGFDINCGMRLVLTNLTEDEVRPQLPELVNRLFSHIPTGVGCHGFLKVKESEFRRVAEMGARWCLKNGMATEEDLAMTEEGGCFSGADSEKVSAKAIGRGIDQLGTLGSGNHYCEIQVARRENIVDELLASTPRLIANHASWKDKWKRQKIETLALLLRGALEAESKVGLKMNIAEKNLAKLLQSLPALRNPTVSTLSLSGWVAVETIIDEHVVRELIPKLKAAGAEGIIEYPLNKVVY